MLNQLLGMPLLLCLALLPVTLVAAALYRQAGGRAALPAGAALAVLGVAVFAQLVFAGLYLLSPAFTDHIEPNTAVVSWIFAQGGQIYHSIDAPERYAFLYGPVPYIATGWLYQLFGAGTLTAKLAGFVCLLLTVAATGTTIRRLHPQIAYPVWVALGYVALFALFFRNHSFWSKPDPFMMAAVAVGMFACTLHNMRMAWIVCGLALGIAVNAKVTGAVYFLPLVAWFMARDGWRAVLAIGLVATALALLPFLFAEQVSLLNYLDWLRSAGDHGISRTLFIQNALFLLFAALPLLAGIVWQQSAPGMRNLLAAHKLTALATFAAAGLILIAASKPGSGPHHFLPFLPLAGVLLADMVKRAWHYRPDLRRTAFVLWAPLAAVLLAAGLKAGFAVYYGVDVVLRQAKGAEIVADLDNVLARFPDSNVYMGYGDGSRYITTFMRHHLVYNGEPYLLDASALMDFQFSGREIPQATLDAFLADTTAVWLIPRDQQPFMLPNWYYRDTGGLLFDDAFRANFAAAFRREGASEYFDIYVARGRSGAG